MVRTFTDKANAKKFIKRCKEEHKKASMKEVEYSRKTSDGWEHRTKYEVTYEA